MATANGKEGGPRGVNGPLLAHVRSLSPQGREAFARAWDSDNTTPSAQRRGKRREASAQAAQAVEHQRQDAFYSNAGVVAGTIFQLTDMGVHVEEAERLAHITEHPVEGTPWRDRLAQWKAQQQGGQK